MPLPETRVEERHDVDAAAFATEIVPSYRPVVLRGLIGDWHSVKAGLATPREASSYLGAFYRGAPAEVFVGPPNIGGRFFYRDDMSGFNFQKRQGDLLEVLNYLGTEGARKESPAIYIGAAPVPQLIPGFDSQNPMPILASKLAVPRIWIGNRTSISTHFDTSDNVACVVSGRRRFIIFPPDQVANLYVGPLDNTMAGQPSSLVSVHEPDFDRFPRFRQALDAAMVADLEPGDAIYIPTLWWHHVDALTPFNILMNYWWNDEPPDAGSPFEAMAHGLMSVSHLPEPRREAWRSFFDHYVFRRNGDPAEHLPIDHRGILGPSTPQLRSRMRNFLLRAISVRPPS